MKKKKEVKSKKLKSVILSDFLTKEEVKEARTKKTSKISSKSIQVTEAIQKPTKEEATKILEMARKVIETTDSHMVIVMAKEGKSKIIGSSTISNLSAYEIAILTLSAFRIDTTNPKNHMLTTLLAEAIVDVEE